MNRLILTILSVATVVGFTNASNADARDRRLELDVQQRHFQGPKTFRLKRKINRQYPNIRLDRFKLERVVLVAKSRRGGGTAELFVGGNEQDRARIDGRPRHFNRPGNFHRVRLHNYARRSRGGWQLDIRGNNKVRKIIVVLKRRGGGGGWDHDDDHDWGGHTRSIDLGSEKASKFVASRLSFRAQYGDVRRVKISGERADVKVLEAYAHFRNGDVERLYNLEGHYDEGDYREARTHGRYISRIEVVAITPGFSGSRGKVRVGLEVER